MNATPVRSHSIALEDKRVRDLAGTASAEARRESGDFAMLFVLALIGP